jgi:hypothetical protein
MRPAQSAENKSAKINKHGGKCANSGGRNSSAGRKKGSPNKLSADVKEAIMAPFNEGAGVDYLKTVATPDPRTFCTLLGKILPDAGRRRCRSWACPHRFLVAAAAVQRVVIPC